METVAFSLDGETVAIVRQFARDGGYPSVSSALRQVVREWAALRARVEQAARGALCDEDVTALPVATGYVVTAVNHYDPPAVD